MFPKNNIARIALMVGLLLSLSFYISYGITKSFDMMSTYTIQLHDTYINVSVWFVWLGLFSVIYSLYAFILVIVNKLKSVSWNLTYIVSLVVLSSFLYYGKAIFDFGFSLLGRIIDTPKEGSWTIYPPLSDIPKELLTYKETLGFWESLLQHCVAAIIVTCGITSVVLLLWTLKLYRSKTT